eukprot:TRINITY_DN105011_c1_g1_i1.p1 TRINITY_DN105011_c1_g1~~TRINITY_DN105011_c1_g1_i1.p1  ORF type:complete len:366 (-),score=78.31 TRINITY_DN105011_c1_g1_i1:139-1236(-)
MNTMDELKNLVLQTLESKGVLGQIRAKLRTCVFKVIEQEDANLKGSGNYLENPMAAKIVDNEDGLICAELIREFLEFYKMDYTLQIFVPECNLSAESKMKDRLPGLLGVGKDDSKGKAPLLAQLVQMVKSGYKANVLGSPLSLASEEPYSEKKSNANIQERLEFSPLREEQHKPKAVPQKEPALDVKRKEVPAPEKKEEPKPIKKEEPKAPVVPEKPVEKAPEKPSLKDPLPPISSIPYCIRQSQIEPFGKLKPLAEKKEEEVKKEPEKIAPQPKVEEKKLVEEPQYERDSNNYNREIEEDIVESDREENTIEEPPGKRAFTESGGLTGSVSIGLDPSVDSLALEDYDYIEPIEKVSQPQFLLPL